MKKPIILLILFLLPAYYCFGQWNRWRYELIWGVGTSAFFGDLGGGKNSGTGYFSVSDFDIQTVGPAFHFGYRYKLAERVAFKLGGSYAVLEGSDAYSGNLRRLPRNLSFRSPLIELGGQLELSIIKEDRSNSSGGRSFITNLNWYLFGGVGGFYFDPRAELEGEWYRLQPLGTEGQGIPGQKDKYSLFGTCYPVGMGMKYYLNRRWSIGLEVGNRFTNTDYIDDVSNDYFDNRAIHIYSGGNPEDWPANPTIAAQLADRRVNINTGLPVPPTEGSLEFRGNPEYKDSYMFVFVNLSYTFKRYKRGKFSKGSRSSGNGYLNRRLDTQSALEDHRSGLNR